MSLDLLPLIIIMALTAYACRAGGYFAMRFVPMTPRLQSALRATPLAVMAGIVATALGRGRLGEAVAIGAVIVLTRLLRSDMLSALAGVAVVAIWRYKGW